MNNIKKTLLLSSTVLAGLAVTQLNASADTDELIIPVKSSTTVTSTETGVAPGYTTTPVKVSMTATVAVRHDGNDVYFGNLPMNGATKNDKQYQNWKLKLTKRSDYVTSADYPDIKQTYYYATDMSSKTSFWIWDVDLKDLKQTGSNNGSSNNSTSTYDTITSTKSVSYTKRISGARNDGVYFNGPYNTSSTTTKANAHASKYNNWKMAITKEVTTSRGATYVYGTDMSGKTSFWIDKSALVDDSGISNSADTVVWRKAKQKTATKNEFLNNVAKILLQDTLKANQSEGGPRFSSGTNQSRQQEAVNRAMIQAKQGYLSHAGHKSDGENLGMQMNTNATARQIADAMLAGYMSEKSIYQKDASFNNFENMGHYANIANVGDRWNMYTFKTIYVGVAVNGDKIYNAQNFYH